MGVAHALETIANSIRQMLGQIHAVMKQANDIDGLTVRHPENHQMAPFSANRTVHTGLTSQGWVNLSKKATSSLKRLHWHNGPLNGVWS